MLAASGRLLPTLIRPTVVVLLSSVSIVGAWLPASEVRAEDVAVRGSEDAAAVWSASLHECIRIALQQSDEIRRRGTVSVNGDTIVIHHNERRIDQTLQFRTRVEDIIREVETAYWDLWLWHRAHETAVSAQRDAAKINKRFPFAEDTASSRKTVPDNPRRDPHFDPRTSVEFVRKELSNTEAVLLELMGAAEDRRQIHPSDEPALEHVEFQLEEVKMEALSNRFELLPAKLNYLYRLTEIERIQGNDQAFLRQHAVHFATDQLRLRSAELEILNEVSDMLGYFDRRHQDVKALLANLRTAEEEFEQVRVRLDRGASAEEAVLDSLRKKADAEWRYCKALRDYAIAVSRVHQSKGTFLDRHGIEVVVGGDADPQKAD